MFIAIFFFLLRDPGPLASLIAQFSGSMLSEAVRHRGRFSEPCIQLKRAEGAMDLSLFFMPIMHTLHELC